MQRSYRLALNSLAALSPFLTPGAASAEPGPALGARAGQTLFFEDFELGWNGWYTDNGVWQVGDPTAGPPGPFSGTKCAATELHGNYDANADSRLIGPSIVLDPVVGDEELHLRFQEWFSYEHCDAGYVQISTFDAGTQVWGAWTTVGEFVEHTSPWSLRDVDLTPFAGEQVRLGFYHTAAYGGGCGGSSTGWYIDDVAIMKCSPVLGGSFESGWEGWGADRGVWQVGSPTTGPAAAFEGTNVAGTVLDSNYGANTDSRLVSPTVRLDPVAVGEELHLRFREWFSYDHCDAGYVQISTYDTGTGTWADWVTLSPYVEHTSPWSLKDVDLTAYA
ncbi:MAG: hypothetical protein GY711_27830, partial [bacterium]|nr:hypothetical protein [bacterium]